MSRVLLNFCYISAPNRNKKLCTIFTCLMNTFEYKDQLFPSRFIFMGIRRSLYMYKVLGRVYTGNKHHAQKFNFTYRYIDDVLSLNNSKISKFIDLIYPCKLDLKIGQSPLLLPHT